MAVTCRIFIMCSLCIFALAALAESTASLSEKQKDQIVLLAYEKMIVSTDELERKIGGCEKIEKMNIFDPRPLRSLSLTDQEVKTILIRFHWQAQEECHGKNTWAEAITDSLQFKYVEKHYKGENVLKTRYNLDILCCDMSPKRYQAEWEYLEIDPEIRKKLEKISELQKPFNLSDAADKMGL